MPRKKYPSDETLDDLSPTDALSEIDESVSSDAYVNRTLAIYQEQLNEGILLTHNQIMEVLQVLELAELNQQTHNTELYISALQLLGAHYSTRLLHLGKVTSPIYDFAEIVDKVLESGFLAGAGGDNAEVKGIGKLVSYVVTPESLKKYATADYSLFLLPKHQP